MLWWVSGRLCGFRVCQGLRFGVNYRGIMCTYVFSFGMIVGGCCILVLFSWRGCLLDVFFFMLCG